MPFMAAAVMAMVLPGLSAGGRQALPQLAMPLNRDVVPVRMEIAKTDVQPNATQAPAAQISASGSAENEVAPVKLQAPSQYLNAGVNPAGLSSALVPAPAMVPAMRPGMQPKYPPPAQAPHKFWDRTNTVGFTVHSVVRIADAVQSCILLSQPGRHEAWLPTKSCAGIATYSLSMIPAQIGTSYLMHKNGHHQLERWVPYFWAAPSAAGIAISFKAW